MRMEVNTLDYTMEGILSMEYEHGSKDIVQIK